MTAIARPLPVAPPAPPAREPEPRPVLQPLRAEVAVAPGELSRLRDEVDRLDRSLIGMITERVRLARRVGAAKRAAGLPTLDPAREASVVRRAGALAREAGLEDEDVRCIFWHLIGLSRRAQLDHASATGGAQQERVVR